ncbi:MAG: transcriptional regulator [Candidatus Methylomirabilales bacterium]
MHPLATRPRPHKVIERHETVRSALRQVLRERPLTARELSARVGISEKEVSGHLEHLVRSLKHSGERLRVEPAQCLACAFVFKERTRLTKPSKCPACRSERLDPPRFVIPTEDPHDRR